MSRRNSAGVAAITASMPSSAPSKSARPTIASRRFSGTRERSRVERCAAEPLARIEQPVEDAERRLVAPGLEVEPAVFGDRGGDVGAVAGGVRLDQRAEQLQRRRRGLAAPDMDAGDLPRDRRQERAGVLILRLVAGLLQFEPRRTGQAGAVEHDAARRGIAHARPAGRRGKVGIVLDEAHQAVRLLDRRDAPLDLREPFLRRPCHCRIAPVYPAMLPGATPTGGPTPARQAGVLDAGATLYDGSDLKAATASGLSCTCSGSPPSLRLS